MKKRGSRMFAIWVGASCLASLLAGCGDSGPTVTYCDVQPILQDRCVRCHGDPLLHGAPFALASYEATREDYQDEPIYGHMARAVRSDQMPPVGLAVEPPVMDLSDDEVELIGSWADAGAPSGGCE